MFTGSNNERQARLTQGSPSTLRELISDGQFESDARWLLKNKMQQELNVESSELKTLWAKLADKKFLTEEELQNKTMTEVEDTRQRDI